MTQEQENLYTLLTSPDKTSIFLGFSWLPDYASTLFVSYIDARITTFAHLVEIVENHAVLGIYVPVRPYPLFDFSFIYHIGLNDTEKHLILFFNWNP